MVRTFTTSNDEPVMVESGGAEMWVMLPAGIALAVTGASPADGDDSSHWVDAVVSADGALTMFPPEVGTLGEGQPDDLTDLVLMTPEEAKRKHPEFSSLFETDQDEEGLGRKRAEREEQAQHDREVLAEVAERNGRLSLAYLHQLKGTPTGARPMEMLELAELYDDESLRQAAYAHPDLDPDGLDEFWTKKGAALGALARMVMAELIVEPDTRQVDLAKQLGVQTRELNDIAYPLRLSGLVDSTKVSGRVVLAPGARYSDIGLDARSAAALIATRVNSPDSWSETVNDAWPKWVAPSPDAYTDYDDVG